MTTNVATSGFNEAEALKPRIPMRTVPKRACIQALQ